MRTVILLFLFIFGLISSFVFMASEAFAARGEDKTISDSLVLELSCNKLSVDNIYKAIRDDAFDESFNVPVQNWAIEDASLPGIANCWALAKAQRMFSYLARYNTSSDKPLAARVEVVLDMIRGSRLVKKGTEKPLQSYQVFEVEESNLKSAKKSVGWNLWKGITYGYSQKLGSDYVFRKLQNEIESLQENRFFTAKNIGMILKGRDRSAEKNRQTLKTLIKNLDGKRLTLLDLRMKRTSQHVVMAKSYTAFSNGSYVFTVYDSNYPWADSLVYFNGETNSFTAPHIVRKFVDEGYDLPVGVFIVDEDERKPFETAMMVHYKKLCRK